MVRLDTSKKEKLAFDGKLIFSGTMKNKKTAYVINDIDKEATPIKIDPADVKAYQADYEFRSKKFENDEKKKEFFKLPDKKGIEHAKPCFYIYLNSRVYFGFSPYLRLKYNWSTKKLLPKHLQKTDVAIDYAKALFGFTQQVMPESSQEDSEEKKLRFKTVISQCEGDVGKRRGNGGCHFRTAPSFGDRHVFKTA